MRIGDRYICCRVLQGRWFTEKFRYRSYNSKPSKNRTAFYTYQKRWEAKKIWTFHDRREDKVYSIQKQQFCFLYNSVLWSDSSPDTSGLRICLCGQCCLLCGRSAGGFISCALHYFQPEILRTEKKFLFISKESFEQVFLFLWLSGRFPQKAQLLSGNGIRKYGRS